MKKVQTFCRLVPGLLYDCLVFAGGWCVQHAAFMVYRPLGYLAIAGLFWVAAWLLYRGLLRPGKGGDAD